MALINDRRISITISGNENNNIIHDTKQLVNFYMFFKETEILILLNFFTQEKERYDDLLKNRISRKKNCSTYSFKFYRRRKI